MPRRKYVFPRLNRIINRIVVELNLYNLYENEHIHIHVEPDKRKDHFFVSVWRKVTTKDGKTHKLLYPSDIHTLKKIANQNHSFWYIDEIGFTISIIT